MHEMLPIVTTAGKHNVTRQNVTVGNFWPMTEHPWQDLKGGWERLRWARQFRSPFETAEAAAESLGMKAGTYRAYERRPDSSKHIELDHQAAVRFARKFKVNWIWLLTGEGEPDSTDLSPAQERIIRATSGVSDEEVERAAAVIEAMLSKNVA